MDNKFIRVDEVAQELSVSKPYAYKLIKKLNDELKEQGFITIAGRGFTGQEKNRERRWSKCQYLRMRATAHGM